MTREAQVELLTEASTRLRLAKLADPGRDAWRLWEHAVASGAECADATATLFWQAIEQRCRHVPIAYITGQRSFYGLEILTSPDVLIPRPDSEVIVDLGCRLAVRTVLDLGTGSGCLLLAILARCPGLQGTGVDICPRAIAVARQNAQRLNLADRCHFFVSDWLASDRLGCYDLILSNPPYIRPEDHRSLSREVREHEPRHALTFGSNGTEAYERIASRATNHLQPGGWLLLELGNGQFRTVRKILQTHGYDTRMIERDLDDRIRALAAQAS